jgi:hypothetical protein
MKPIYIHKKLRSLIAIGYCYARSLYMLKAMIGLNVMDRVSNAHI